MTYMKQRIWDPLYGRTNFTDFEYKLITSPEVQRLRYIRMCNINSMLVVGAADICRFEHSIGVLRLANEWISANSETLTLFDANNIRAAALLHDMQTGPYGHSFQYILEDNEVDGDFSHEDISTGMRKSFYQDLDANASFAGKPFSVSSHLNGGWRKIAEMIRGKGRFGPLIAGVMDLDNIDNVIRLAYHVGITTPEDNKLPLKLARVITPWEGGLSIPADAVDMIKQWQEVRKSLYTFLLLDWADFSAKAMLTQGMELAVDADMIGADSWVLTDEDLFRKLEDVTGEKQDVSELARRIRTGDLYDPIVLGACSSTELYPDLSQASTKRKIESDLSSIIKAEYGSTAKFLFHPILDHRKTQRAVSLRIAETGDMISVGCDSHRLLLGVFSSRRLPDLEGVKALTLSYLKALGICGISEFDDPFLTRQGFSQASASWNQMSLF